MMTKNLRALLRVQLLGSWRGFRDNLAGGNGRSKWGLLLIPLALLGFVPLLALMVGLFFSLFVAGKAVGMPEIVLSLAFTAGQVACLTFGVFYVISAFYFAKDLKLLIPMPLRPGEIVVAKFLSILLGEYMTLLPIILPAIIIYGLFGGVAGTFIPYALVIFLLLPIVPLVISSLFSMVLMRVTNLRRNRDLWRVLGALIGVGLGFLFNFMSRYGTKNGRFGGNVDQIQAMLEQQKSMLHAIGRYFPTAPGPQTP
jgi:ABC-2 type transport system permease protein